MRGVGGVGFGSYYGIIGLCSRMSWFYLGFCDFGVDFRVIRWNCGIFRELKVVENKGLFEGASK